MTFLECIGKTITHLDVSKNVKLATLDCSENPLENIDVSNNVALTKLNCSVNSLKTLDVSKNTELLGLFCNYNYVEKLDLSHNTKLQVLGCSGNALKNLDLSANVALNRLMCDRNEISELDLSKNTNLALIRITQNPIPVVVNEQSGIWSVDLTKYVKDSSRVSDLKVTGSTFDNKNKAVILNADSPTHKITYSYSTGYKDQTMQVVLDLSLQKSEGTEPPINPNPSQDPSGLSNGAIAGIVVISVFVSLAIAYGLFAILYKKKIVSGKFIEKVYPFIKF